MARTVTNQQLTPGSVFFVRGQVGFARISRQTTDEERARDNARRMHKIEKNYTTLTLYNAQVLAKNPNQPTPEEIYGAESCYNSSKPSDYPGKNFTALNKSKMLPKVGILKEGSNPNSNPTYTEIQLEGEPAKGTDVTVVMRVFAGQGNNGVSMDTILINQPEFQYYGNNANVKNALNDYGITFEAMPPSEKKPVPTGEPMGVPMGGMDPAANAPEVPQAAQAPQASQNIFNSFGSVPATPPQMGATPFDFAAQNQAPQPAPEQSVQFGLGQGRQY